MQWQIAPVVLALLLLPLFLLSPLFLPDSSASASGLLNEVISNDKVQLYVVSVKEDDRGGASILVNVEVVLKNMEDNARIFNPFFAKVIDSSGDEVKANPLYGTVQPIRIASNDILRGILSFAIPRDHNAITLIWSEFDAQELVVDLAEAKEPADDMPKSDWILAGNKGKVLSDDKTQLIIHDELLNRSATSAFYLVDISIKNLGSEPKLFNPTFAFVKDRDGYLYPADIQDFQLMNNPLKKGQLMQGEEVRGEILFLLPSTVNNVMLIYDENLGTGSYFVVPEFPYLPIVLVASIGTGLLLARLVAKRMIGTKEYNNLRVT